MTLTELSPNSEVKSTMSTQVKRPGARARGYSTAWQKYARAYLKRHRWCELCTHRGRNVRARVVDHIVPHRGDQRLFWDPANHQPLCGTCHNSAKQAAERTGRVRGCDQDGVPLDPGHHWRGQRRGQAP